MIEKKPVYNGYEEMYLNGKELKELFDGRYYTDGRHHSEIICVSIIDYLSYIRIKDDKLYRVFYNNHFCRIMNGETDKLISFFGHAELDGSEICCDPLKMQLENNCSICGKKMALRHGKYGWFLGCTGYPECKHTIKIPVIAKN